MKNLPVFFTAIAMLIFQTTAAIAGATGNIYTDAVTIVNDKKNNDKEDIKNILAFYARINNPTPPDLNAIVAGNPFFLELLGRGYFDTSKQLAAAAAPEGGFAAFGGANVTTIADGITKFMIKRAQQELAISVFEQFNDDLNKYPELKTLFPLSVNIIENVESYNINSVLQELKDAFMKDLLNLPTNVLALRDLNAGSCISHDSTCIKRITSLANFLNSTSHPDSRAFVVPLIAIQGIINGKNIIDISNDITTDRTVCGKSDDLSGCFQLTSIILQSLRSGQDNLFITNDKIRILFSNKDQLDAFLGIIYLKYNTLDCYKNLTIDGKKLIDFLNAVKSGQTIILNTLSSVDQISVAFANLKTQLSKNTGVSDDNYSSLISLSLQLFTGIPASFSQITNIKLPDEYTSFTKNLEVAGGLSIDIQKKNYAGIFNGFIVLINQNKIFDNSPVKEKLIKYLSFAANLASATNSDEVEQAIEAVALPAGSFTLKQNSSFNISINGYLGYARNWVTDTSGFNYWGVYAPLGISFSWGLHKAGALTIFGSVIDLGGLAGYHVSNSSTDSLKQVVTLESIFSPLLEFKYEIATTPITIGAGFRYTPRLTYDTHTGFQIQKPRPAIFLGASIDIPFFTVKNTPFNKN